MWHDPLINPAAKRSSGARRLIADEPAENGALPPEGRPRKKVAPKRNGARIVAAARTSDPRELERERLLDRVLRAEGRPSISNAVEAYLQAGFELPRSQEVWLQLLEHSREDRVAEAIDALSDILEAEEPIRRAVLESRLRRIEELAEELPTQRSAASLRRLLNTKYAETLS